MSTPTSTLHSVEEFMDSRPRSRSNSDADAEAGSSTKKQKTSSSADDTTTSPNSGIVGVGAPLPSSSSLSATVPRTTPPAVDGAGALSASNLLSSVAVAGVGVGVTTTTASAANGGVIGSNINNNNQYMVLVNLLQETFAELQKARLEMQEIQLEAQDREGKQAKHAKEIEARLRKELNSVKNQLSKKVETTELRLIETFTNQIASSFVHTTNTNQHHPGHGHPNIGSSMTKTEAGRGHGVGVGGEGDGVGMGVGVGVGDNDGGVGEEEQIELEYDSEGNVIIFQQEDINDRRYKKWLEKLEVLKQYTIQNDGNLPVCQYRNDAQDGFALGRWVANQRSIYHRMKKKPGCRKLNDGSKITQRRIDDLEHHIPTWYW